MTRKILLLYLNLFLGMVLYAQSTEDTTSTSKDPDLENFQFTVFTLIDQGILQGDAQPVGLPRVFYDSPTGPEMIPLARNGRSKTYPYSGELPLRLFNIHTKFVDPPEDAPPGTPPTRVNTRIPITNVSIAPGMDRVMVVLFPAKRLSDRTLASVALPYTTSELRPGMVRMYNGTDQNLVFKFPDSKDSTHRIAPNGVWDFTPGDVSAEKSPRFYIYGINERGQLRGLHTNRLFIKDNETNIYLIEPKGKRVGIMSLGGHASSGPSDSE